MLHWFVVKLDIMIVSCYTYEKNVIQRIDMNYIPQAEKLYEKKAEGLKQLILQKG